MAIPKPLRALAIVSAFLFFFLVFQLFKKPSLPGSSGDLEQPLPNEPTAEGTAAWPMSF